MTSFIGSKEVVARFVADILMDSRFDSASITIITLARSEDCSVRIATDTSLEDIVWEKAMTYFDPRTNTSTENTQGG